MRLSLLLLIFSFLSFTGISQNLPEHYNPNPLPFRDTHSVFLSIDNTNFFKNNEYDNKYVAGYSKIGFFINPTVSWIVSGKTRVSGGLHLLKFSGEAGFNQVKPVFFIQHQLMDGIDLMMGSIRSTHHHGLIDPLYHYERFLDENIENGVQFLIDRPYVQGDIWVNWKNFIFRGDDAREKFETGVSTESTLYGKDQNFGIKFPFQLLFEHKGGQIDNSGKPVSTLFNFAGGPAFQLDIHPGFLQSLEWKNLYVGYRDLSPGNIHPIQKGGGLISTLAANMEPFQFQLSWWKAGQFLSFAGNPVYQVYSIRNERLIDNQRELFIGKLRYSKQYRDLHFIINFDTYWDPLRNSLDYGFGLYLLLNTDIFLTNVEKNRGL